MYHHEFEACLNIRYEKAAGMSPDIEWHILDEAGQQTVAQTTPKLPSRSIALLSFRDQWHPSTTYARHILLGVG